MNKEKPKDLTKPPFSWEIWNKEQLEHSWGTERRAGKFRVPQLTKKDIIMRTSTLDILCATDEDEFYYETTNELVPEGEPVGIDVDTDKGVELVLFSNVYWQPNYE